MRNTHSSTSAQVADRRSPHLADRASFWRMRPVIWLFGILVLAYALLGGYVLLHHQPRPWNDAIAGVNLGQLQNLRLNLEALAPDRLYAFSFSDGQGGRLPYVLHRTSEDGVHAGLATCRTCARTVQPHYVEGDRVICGRCRRSMRIPGPSEERGGRCDLVGIPYSQTDGEITVQAEAVQSTARTVNR